MFETFHATFGTPWKSLSADNLTAFFEGDPHEDLLWDAKRDPGKPSDLKNIVWKAACAFANSAGGTLVLGVAEDGENGWHVEGMQFRFPEPINWVSSVIRQLQPTPTFDVDVVQIDADAYVLLVAVERVSNPPCRTPSKDVFVRRGDQSVRPNAAEMRQLSAAGGRAATTAKNASAAAAKEGLKLPIAHFGFGLGALARPADARVFNRVVDVEQTVIDTLSPVYDGLVIDPIRGPEGRHGSQLITGATTDDHTWFVHVDPVRMSVAVYASGRAGSWIPETREVDEWIRWVSVAKDVAIAVEQTFGTPPQSPTYMSVARRYSAHYEKQPMVITRSALLSDPPGWNDWVRTELGNRMPLDG